MEVLKRGDSGYLQDPTKFLDFSRFCELGAEDVLLIEGAFEQSRGWEQFNLSPARIMSLKNKKIVRLEFEEPNKFFIGDVPDGYDKDFYKIFTLCPYTADYFNKKLGLEKRVPIFFPFNENYIPPKRNKSFDVIYTGHIVSKSILEEIEILKHFDYRFVSNSAHSLVTDQGVGYEEKIDLISQSRVTLVSNLLYPNFKHLLSVWKYPKWRENSAFSELPGFFSVVNFFHKRSRMVVPQIKSRVFEAAFSRSLILCKRDPFNVIENFFKPGEEFIYYEEGQLRKTLSKILRSYKDYESVVESAYQRAVREYTTAAFFEKYIRKL